MSVRLLTEHSLEFLSLTGCCKAHLSLHLSKCHIVGNHMLLLIFSCTLLPGVGVLTYNYLTLCTIMGNFECFLSSADFWKN